MPVKDTVKVTGAEKGNILGLLCLIHALDSTSSGEFMTLWISVNQCQSVTGQSRLSLSLYVLFLLKRCNLHGMKIIGTKFYLITVLHYTHTIKALS